MSKKRIGTAIFLWDTAWKAVAIVTAIRNRQYRWIGPLVLVNSVGILPMVYLLRFAGREEDELNEEPDFAAA